MESSIFNPQAQRRNEDFKIIVALERLSEAFRVLLWDQAKVLGISPIQIQVLTFIQFHGAEKCTVSFLAQEFNMSKPTISDAVKTLEQKGLIARHPSLIDTRSHSLHLTDAGKLVASKAAYFAQPMLQGLSTIPAAEKGALLAQLLGIIEQLQHAGIISLQRMCLNCEHHQKRGDTHYCNFMKKVLKNPDLQVDCKEFVSAIPIED